MPKFLLFAFLFLSILNKTKNIAIT
jgi:hypothetical protein